MFVIRGNAFGGISNKKPGHIYPGSSLHIVLIYLVISNLAVNLLPDAVLTYNIVYTPVAN